MESAKALGKSDRIGAILEEMRGERYSICLERPTLLDSFWRYREPEEKHPYIERSEALAYIYANRKPRIYNNELIIGNISSKRIAANYYSEGGSVHILEDIFQLEKRPVLPMYLTKKEKIKLLSLGVRHTNRSVAAKAFLRPGKVGNFMSFFMPKKYYITEEAGVSHLVPDHGKVVGEGLAGTYEFAVKKLDKGGLGTDSEAFYQGIIIVIDGIKKMAENLAEEAAGEAARAPFVRRRELLETAEICRRVPYYPARSFREAIQAVWLIHLALNLEDFEQGISFGRLDQILYPFYKKDIKEKRLNDEEALELLASLCLKCGETIPLYSRRINRFFGGNAVGQGITLGGTDMEGDDATNELSGLVLKTFALASSREPSLHARIHGGSPEWFLRDCAGLVQEGSGKPSFFNDEKVVDALTNAGFSKEHARDYAVIGCVEMGSQGRTYNSSDAALFNLPLCLELALNCGVPFTGRKRLGAVTRSVESMVSFDEVVNAFRRQVEAGVAETVGVITDLEKTYRVYRPTPLNSILTEGCVEEGKDVTGGGAMYDYTSLQGVGLADAGDSLYAIKKLVFEDNELSLSELVAILKNNFYGFKKLQTRLCNKFPRYGNNHNGCDEMVNLAAKVFTETVTRHNNSRGGKYIAGFYSMTCHQGFGEVTGALPNGRGAGLRFANGLSPADGCDQNGPTDLLGSAAGLDSREMANCYALNLKFEKSMVQAGKGRDIIASTVKSFFDMGGMQLQVNVLDAAVLRAAKANPGAYPNIVVRVSGYCSYFRDLAPEVQDEIIERTAYSSHR